MTLLTEKYRPQVLNDIVGQQHIAGPNGMVTKMLDNNALRSLIFSGPPGCGKTSVAKIIAQKSGLEFRAFNATETKTDDIRKAIAANTTDKPLLVYIDEIQYFTTKQQQTLLPHIESGKIILIAATTENPYHCCYKALLSRCNIVDFKPVPAKAIAEHLQWIATKEQQTISQEIAEHIANACAGDVRRSINLMEQLFMQYPNGNITVQNLLDILPSINMATFDTNGDDHYDLLSGLQKSIRGSDPNAAVFYLARLLEGGDILSPCRRLQVIASEDIGFGNLQAIPLVYACVQMAQTLGMPEAAKPLTIATICLAISPKSSTAENTYNAAAKDVHAGFGGVVPNHLRPIGRQQYKFPHNYPHHWVPQQYLPDDLVGQMYYTPDDNTFEQQMAQYWAKIMCNPAP